MDTEREAQHRRLTEPHRSKASKLAWKRHRDSYNRANRKKERDNMNKSFYSIAKELQESINSLYETDITNDDIFDLTCDIAFTNITGGIGFHINKDTGEVSFTSSLMEKGSGNYRLENMPEEEALKGLYEELKDELEQVIKTVDHSISQIIAKHGLRQA